MNKILYTIGHSTHSVDYFIELLKKHGITAICDVRSQPYSQYNSQFNRENLKEELKKNKIEYVFLGIELGARSENPECYIDGQVQYDLLAKESLFQKGINRLCRGMQQYSIALMCAEKDPIACHRTILVCREMRYHTEAIKHILADASIETNEQLEERLLEMFQIQPDMFREKRDCIEDAYDKQARRIAYTKKEELVPI